MIIIIVMIDFQRNENAVSPVLGAILILAIGVSLLTTVQLNFVPVWNAQEELDHIKKMLDDFKQLKSGIESGVQSGTTSSLPLSMGFRYSPKMLVYNPMESAYASLEIQENAWAEVRYNEVFPEGMTDDTSIKNVSTSTITYALKGTQNYNSFIYEHGMIRRSSSNYTANSQTILANGTIYLLGVKPLGSETTTGNEMRTLNIYPTSQQKNSVIGKKVWLILHTRPEYVSWWKAATEREGGVIKMANDNTGTIIIYVDTVIIKMGEVYISAGSRIAPAHAPPYRLIKVTPDNTNLPVDGTTALAVEVQDFYNNPVPNVIVSFSMNTSRVPGNAYAAASLLQNSAVTGADGRANAILRTEGAGFYYVDANLANYTDYTDYTDYTTTFVYPASSQGGFLILNNTGAGPTYQVIATMKDGLGNNVPDGTRIDFDTSDGNVSLSWASTTVGNASTSLNITNASGIRITNIQSSGISAASSTISWDTINNIAVTAKSGFIFNSIDVPTNVNTTGCVHYGTVQKIYPYTDCDPNILSSHSIILSSLQASTAYYFIVNSSRPGNAGINSTEYMFVTPESADILPPAQVTGMNNAAAPLYITWSWTDPEDADFDHVEVYIDDIFRANVPRGDQSFNATYFMPNTTHTIRTRTVDIYGNVNATWVNNTASTPSLFTYVFDFDSMNATGTVTNFINARSAGDGASANMTEAGVNGTTQLRGFFNASDDSWSFSSNTFTCAGGANCSVSSGNNVTDGSPAGSLYANLTVTGTSKTGSTATSWRSQNFSVAGIPINASLYFSLRNSSSYGGSVSGTFEVMLIKPAGSKLIYPTTTIDTSSSWLNFSNASISPSDLSQSGNYSIMLNSTLNVTSTGASGGRLGYLEVHWDNPVITVNSTFYRLNMTTNTTVIPDAPNTLELQLGYNVSNETFVLQVWDGAAWNNRTTLNDTSLSYRNITLTPGELIPDGTMTGSAGTVNKYLILVRYLDVNASAVQGRLYLDYQRVFST